MDKRFLEDCLEKGMSLVQIGKLADADPSTVGYWVKKHDLRANGAEKYAPRGGIVEEVLEIMVEEDLTLEEMAEELDRSIPTVRYWLKQYGLQATGGRRRRRRALEGPKHANFECRRHGPTEFVLEGRGYYRCKRCRAAAVTKRRRAVKQKLVEEAGGACALCGYDRSSGALQFHHLDPTCKEFHIAHRGHSRSLARCRQEIRKCVLLCANCHAEIEDGTAELPVELTTREGLSQMT
jgi:transposase-like protein